jgi:hypothetical protein
MRGAGMTEWIGRVLYLASEAFTQSAERFPCFDEIVNQPELTAG